MYTCRATMMWDTCITISKVTRQLELRWEMSECLRFWKYARTHSGEDALWWGRDRRGSDRGGRDRRGRDRRGRDRRGRDRRGVTGARLLAGHAALTLFRLLFRCDLLLLFALLAAGAAHVQDDVLPRVHAHEVPTLKRQVARCRRR